MGPREIILTTIVPGTIVGVALLLAWMLNARRKEPGQGPQWVAPIAFAFAFALASWAAEPLARWWPIDGSKRLPHVAVFAMFAGLGCVWLRKPRFAIHALAALSLALAIWAVIGTLPAVSLPRTNLVIWIAAVTIGGSAILGLTHDAARESPAWLAPMHYALMALATGAICMFSQIAIFAMMAGSLVAISTAAAIVGLIRKNAVLGPGGTLVLYTLLASLCVGASQFAPYPLHVTAYVLLLCAPLGSLAARLPRNPNASQWKPVVSGILGLIVLLISAVAIGFFTRHISIPYEF